MLAGYLKCFVLEQSAQLEVTPLVHGCAWLVHGACVVPGH
jgi:hypothetical protein